MKRIIDARGENCPIPVILAKKEMDETHGSFMIKVDDDIAVENLNKLAKNQGYTLKYEVNGKETKLFFRPEEAEALLLDESEAVEDDVVLVKNPFWVVFMGKDYIGDGDYKLGHSLAKMFFYTLSQAGDIPESILFMNSGVKLLAMEDQVVEHLKLLEKRGTEILVCGTCLDYYKLKDRLQIGEISNMYDITEKMFAASKVVSL
ncbi:MAG: sulfurtransferase-like selenium metabolism protein YedF [Eubacterium sp.]